MSMADIKAYLHVFTGKGVLFKTISLTIIVVLLAVLASNIVSYMQRKPIKQISHSGTNIPRPTQTALRIGESYSGIDYAFNPEHDAIADNAVCRDTKTFVYTSFAPAAADPEHTCSLTISSDSELEEFASLSDRFTNLKILKITGTTKTHLPAEIGRIHSLSRLIIHNTDNTVLPPQIGDLVNLVELTVDDAHLTQLPSEVGRLINLEELTVSNNKELHSLPQEIGNLPYLWKIIAINNSLDGLPVLPRLKHGTVLSLKGNKLTQFPPVLLSRERDIVSLDLSDNVIQSVPSEINRTHIRVLVMSNNQLTSFPSIETMQLLSLNLSGNKLISMRSLPSKDWLKALDLSNNQLTSITLSLSEMANLQSLLLGGNSLAILPALPDAKGMKELDISFNKLTSLPEGLEHLKGLTKINISGNTIPQEERDTIKDLFPNAEIVY